MASATTALLLGASIFSPTTAKTAAATTANRVGARLISPATRKTSSSSAVISMGAFCTSAPYASGASVDTANSTNKKTTLPSPSVPIAWVEINGQRLPCYIDTQSWWAYHSDLDNRRLGGQTAPTVPDLSTNVVYVKEQAVELAATTSAINQMAEANAQTLIVVKEVVQNASLSGSSSIPTVQATTGRSI